jgi:hypothetical protein
VVGGECFDLIARAAAGVLLVSAGAEIGASERACRKRFGSFEWTTGMAPHICRLSNRGQEAECAPWDAIVFGRRLPWSRTKRAGGLWRPSGAD